MKRTSILKYLKDTVINYVIPLSPEDLTYIPCEF